MSSIDQQFIEFVVKSLVGHPDKVKIERRIDEKGVLLELTVDPEDLGRVIGKRGATAQSLRTLLRALGTKNDARYNLKIVDNGIPFEKRSSVDQLDHVNEPVAQTEEVQETETVSQLDEDLSEAQQDDQDQPNEDSHDRLSKTRQELEEMDDLDL